MQKCWNPLSTEINQVFNNRDNATLKHKEMFCLSEKFYISKFLNLYIGRNIVMNKVAQECFPKVFVFPSDLGRKSNTFKSSYNNDITNCKLHEWGISFGCGFLFLFGQCLLESLTTWYFIILLAPCLFFFLILISISLCQGLLFIPCIYATLLSFSEVSK